MKTTNPITSAQLLGALNWRYATKKFDASKKISAETWTALEQSLVLSPSSFGIQPWKFFVVNNPAVRARLSTASYGQTQPVDASHYVVFAVRKNIGDEHLDKYVERMAKVRGVTTDDLKPFRQAVGSSVEQLTKAGLLNISQAQQAFIALGQFMTSAALLGVDTCALGGIDREKYVEILGLNPEEYMVVVACAAGYRAADDKYASYPKVRFDTGDVIAHV